MKGFLLLPFRSVLRQGQHSIISTLGLAIALSCSILIMLYVRYELSFDRYHENFNSIYRVLTKHSDRERSTTVVTPATLSGALLADIPEAERSCRCKFSSYTIEYNSTLFSEKGFLFADKDLLEMFTFPVLSGNPSESLDEPFTVFLTESTARKYFGNIDPTGKTIKADNRYVFTIRGVLKDIPANSHFRFDFLTGFETLNKIKGGKEQIEQWTSFSYLTYVQLAEGTNPDNVVEKLAEFPRRYLPDDPIFKGTEWTLQPLAKIHLGGNFSFDPSVHSNVGYIYLVVSIGIFILLIAVFNYMNMATARSYSRSREIGIIKVAGSSRTRLVFQLVSESVILSFAGLCLAFYIVSLVLPVFAVFTERPLTFGMIFTPSFLIKTGILTIILGVSAGIIPSLRLSSFNPLGLINDTFAGSAENNSSFVLKNLLIGLQYIISIIALVATYTVFNQLSYIKNADLGFSRQNILTIVANDPALKNDPGFLINELRKNPKIYKIAASSGLPYNISARSYGLWEGKPAEFRPFVSRIGIDGNFIELYDLDIISGRGFSKDFRDDSLNNIIINQTAARMIGKENPVGLKFGFQKDKIGTIIGVVKDFNYRSLNFKIEPLALSVAPGNGYREIQYLSVRVNPGYLPEVREFIEKTLKEVSPAYLNPVSFLDENINRMYMSDRKLAAIILFSTMLGLILTCLGQYSLSFFTTQKRVREMAIRKVFGANPRSILTLFVREVLKIVLISVTIAWPLSYLAMNKWLQHYAFRIELKPGYFIYSMVITILVSLAVISYHVIKLSRINPAEAIRYN